MVLLSLPGEGGPEWQATQRSKREAAERLRTLIRNARVNTGCGGPQATPARTLLPAHPSPEEVASGYAIKTVAKGSPMDEAGIRGGTMLVNLAGQAVPLGGDIVLTVQGIPATAANLAKVRDELARMPAGSPVKMTILRAGQVLEVSGKLP
ncbi:MAG TPA: PDZ domain-containing protein [Candidatus Sulfotelmatobacter sp.]|nr:PDZ domain-containing protein [Candidatus Sulfotelmatobacter sp.]